MEVGLCARCDNFQRVEAKEVGVILGRCDIFKRDMTTSGPITDCTSFEDKGMPMLFVRSAWTVHKCKGGKGGKGQGVTFRSPGNGPCKVCKEYD